MTMSDDAPIGLHRLGCRPSLPVWAALRARPAPRDETPAGQFWLLEQAPGAPWSAADQTALLAWFTEWLEWQVASDEGHAEAAAQNNHGSFYDLMAAGIAVYAANHSVASAICAAAPAKPTRPRTSAVRCT